MPAPLWAQGGAWGHIPRWLCLRNAVGALLRRLPPSFFINRINSSILANILIILGQSSSFQRVSGECCLHLKAAFYRK